MSDELVEITVDGQTLRARKGAMLITATDAAGIDIPRFCYHDKLSVAANCRMCLVDVERAPKPLPACATPIMPGMVVRTRSKLARAAQRGSMEFLLINHPLDCPICDQGGECELQDVAMGYGEGVSQYAESKRVVVDNYIGPLIATELTRCIQCTRCVRFGEEIAGLRELGMTGRGENMRISTFMAGAVESELSGNVVDLCPVGALTMRPSRFTARSWELQQHAALASHDCLGSNLWLHSRGGRVMRAVPRENESINQIWLSDRDRYSYQGLASDERLLIPQRKVDGRWREIDWPEALQLAADTLRTAAARGGDQLAALVSPNADLESLYLAQKLLRGLGSDNIDHRLRQCDFRGQGDDPVMPWLGADLADLATADAVLVIGGNPRKEQPLLNLRLRECALGGGQVSFLNPRRYPQTLETHAEIVCESGALCDQLDAICEARDGAAAMIASSLREAGRGVVLLGSQAMRHPDYAALRARAARLAEACGARLGYLPEAANSCGAALAGCLPHRGPAGVPLSGGGAHAGELLAAPRAAVLLFGVEPGSDVDDPQGCVSRLRASARAGGVIGIQSFVDESLRECCDLLLPMAAFAESGGTLVNAAGQWQRCDAAVPPGGAARPAWKIFRMLGEMLELPGFEQRQMAEVCDEIRSLCREVQLDNRYAGGLADCAAADRDPGDGSLPRCGDVPPYCGEPLLRRASALQKSADGDRGLLRLSPAEAGKRGFADGQRVVVHQKGSVAGLQLVIDDSIPDGVAWIPTAAPDVRQLGPLHGRVSLEVE